MPEVTMLTVKTSLDDTGLKKLEARVASSLEVARKLVEQFNKNAALTVNTDAFAKGVQKIEQALKSLREQCEQVEFQPDTAEFEEKLGTLEARLSGMERDYQLTLKVNADELLKAEAMVEGLGQKQSAGAGKESAKTGKTLEDLEEEYTRAKELNDRLYDSKEERDTNFAATHKQHLESKLKLLEAEALQGLENEKKVKEETIAGIQEVKAELEQLKETGLSFAEVNKGIQGIATSLTTLSTQINALNQQRLKNRINSLTKSYEKEKELLQEKLDAEMSMYDEQLEQYADLEKEKEDLTKDHNERMDELNSEMQDHLTEDEWLALQERMNDETLRYEESMTALEADTIARDEIQAQKELAEKEALARKEKMEKDYAVRKAKLERKQAEATKKTNMFQAIVTTAAGIARAFADHAFPFSAVVAALVAAAGAVQVAAISAQPLPEIPSFRTGGTLGGGTVGADNIHHYRNLPGPDNPYDKTLFWGQQGEEVLPLDEAEAYRALRDQGFHLADLLEGRRLAQSYVNGSSHIDNSKHVAQNLTIQARNELTFAEARRLARKQNRALVRALA